MAITIETLQYPDNRGQMRDLDTIVFGIQKNIIKNRKFIDFNGQIHRGLYLEAPQIILTMKDLLPKAENNCTKTITNAKKIISAGWEPLMQTNYFSTQGRRIALKYLLTLSNIAFSATKQEYKNRKINEQEFRNKIQPIEGTRLSAFSELYPQRYRLLERFRIQK